METTILTTQPSQPSDDLGLDRTDHLVEDNPDAELPVNPSVPARWDGGELVLSDDEKIDLLEIAICSLPTVIDLPVKHTFTPGLYVRELRCPAGVLATTYIHKQEHPFVLAQGEVSVFADVEETKVMRIKAPYMGVTKVGTRRVVYVHEDAVWLTFHPMEEKSIDEAERELFEFRTLPDGTNVKDRFRAALERQALPGGNRPELTGGMAQ
jgi:hypothetical protein